MTATICGLIIWGNVYMCICDYKIIFVIEKMRVGQANHMKSEIKTAGPYSRRENTFALNGCMFM